MIIDIVLEAFLHKISRKPVFRDFINDLLIFLNIEIVLIDVLHLLLAHEILMVDVFLVDAFVF